MKFRYYFLFPLTAALVFGQSRLATSARPVIPVKTRAMLNRITPDELKGDLSFLASDALAGRYTPSPGLDAAAEFIASRFRAAGLEPAGDDGYFQTARMVDRRLPKLTSDLNVQLGSRTITVPAAQLQLYTATSAAKFDDAPALVFHSLELAALKSVDVKDKAVLYAQPDFTKLPREEMIAAYRKLRGFSNALRNAGASLEIVASNTSLPGVRARLLSSEAAAEQERSVLIAASQELLQALANAKEAKVTVDIPPPEDTKITARNVVAILRGSDPKLKDTCVLLTAHYDHIGTLETAAGMAMPVKNPGKDRIYNGANDDGSGTVSVIEIARAFAGLTPHPKRSILFMTFFGEERGELGSKYYADHPICPLSKTVADINLEQLGRTDSTEGKQVNTASLTGYDYSDVTRYLEKAGALTGIKVYKDPAASDPYFSQSDNAQLAEKGVPAHSLTVAFDYPDYHGLGDEWQKIDYENMARVDRMIALAVLNIANAPQPPVWNAQNPKTAPFRQARQESGKLSR